MNEYSLTVSFSIADMDVVVSALSVFARSEEQAIQLVKQNLRKDAVDPKIVYIETAPGALH